MPSLNADHLVSCIIAANISHPVISSPSLDSCSNMGGCVCDSSNIAGIYIPISSDAAVLKAQQDIGLELRLAE
jgi:hypothetical protein